jgi:flagellar biosynthesis GTPase FlhF
MTKHAFKLASLISIFLAVALFVPLRAVADEEDPPSRVARLSYTHGPVSFQPAGTDDWVSAVVNRPMTTDDKLWSDQDGRAELHIGSASIRLGRTTGFSFLNLTDDITLIRVTEGTVRIRVKRLGENETFEVDTPNLAFSVLRPGTYKINVNEEGDTTLVTVFSGEAEVTGGGQAFSVRPGEVGTFTGTDQLNGDIQGYDRDGDDFDRWCSDRDHREDHAQSSRYVSPDVVGYEDLDDYGGWRPVPEYGTVWFPHTTVVGWAPYRYGHWVWISPWGWTWVEDEPWGFAPFHYGRWVVVGGVWGWVPCPPAPVVVGVAYVRPVYAPALVAWVGGEHWGVGVGVGSVAWFPLGPREVYVPSYPVSRTYVNNVNVTNTTVNNTVVNNYYNNVVVNKNVNVTNVTYVNQAVPGAVTATSHTAFTSAQPVAKNIVKVDPREVARAQVNVTTPPVVPPKQAVLGAGETTSVKPPARVEDRAVVAKKTPPPPPPSFEKQRQVIQANGGKPPAISEVHKLEPENARASIPVKIAPPARPVTPNNVRTGNPPQPQNAAGNKPDNNKPDRNDRSRPNTNAANKPGSEPANSGQPGQGNKPAASISPVRDKTFSDRPPSARPSNAVGNANPQLDAKHQQDVQNLHQKQDQERQKVEQQQIQEQKKLDQKKADDQAKAQLQEKQQRQLQQLENKHSNQDQKLEQKHQQEVKKEKPSSKPPKEDKPPHR